MTNLGRKWLQDSKSNSIWMDVSGDLSHSFAVTPKGERTNVGLKFGDRTKAVLFARQYAKESWHNQIAAYEKLDEKEIGKFKYLPPETAKEYVGRNKEEGAYGEYAEHIRKRYKIG